MALAFIVETGSGSSTATSLTTTAFVDDYVATFYPANTTWAALATGDKEQTLIRATQSLSLLFCTRWKGQQVQFEQALDWPRYPVEDLNGYLVDATSIPEAVARAVAELAILDAEGFVVIAQSTTAGAAIVKRTTKKLGPLESTIEYAEGSGTITPGVVTDKVVPKLRHILCHLLEGAGSGFAERGG